MHSHLNRTSVFLQIPGNESHSYRAAYPRLCLPTLSACHYTSHALTSLSAFGFCSLCKYISLFGSVSGGTSLKTGRIPAQSYSTSSLTAVGFHSDNMCTGKCSRCIAVALYPLALISIICNIVLFFPGGDVKYAKDGHITEEVKYMGGLVGGGVMVSCLLWCDARQHAA